MALAWATVKVASILGGSIFVALCRVDGVAGSRDMTRASRCVQNHSAAFRTGWIQSLLVQVSLGGKRAIGDQHTSALGDARHTRAARGGRKPSVQAATGRTVLQRSQTRAFGFGFSKVHAVQTQAPPMVGTGASGAGAASAAAA